MNEDKSARYHRLRRRAGLLSAAAAAVLLTGLVATRASVSLRGLSEQAAGALAGPGPAWPWIVVGVYVTLLVGLHELVTLPAAFYRGFLLERRYGLSRESFSVWAVDHAKAVMLGWVFGLGGSAVLYGLLRSRPADWWIPAGAIFSLTTVALAHLAPVVLLPIFYHLRPLDRDLLRARLKSLAGRAGSRIVGVYEWQLGERTRRANAALVGLGRTRRILVSDTLLAEYSDEEIEAVLAHELGHHVRHDIWRSIAYETALIFAGLFVADRALRVFGSAANLTSPADVTGLPILLLAMGGLSVLQRPLANALSRRQERLADRFALALTGRPAAFISVMRRLAAQNLAEEEPSRLVRIFFHTHPPTRERIAAASSRAST